MRNEEKYRFLSLQEDIESIMNISTIDVLCSNSIVLDEGISNALIEFMALQKPVNATKDGGSVELIEEGRSGFLIGYKAVIELENKICHLLDDDDLRVAMGTRAYNIVKTKFSMDSMISEFRKE